MAVQPMTAEDARTFSGFSVANAVTVKSALQARGCACEPYTDVFTFGRWVAQGRAVRKGEHGIPLPVVIQTERTDEKTGETVARRLLRRSYVFCRCQTDERS